MLENGRNDESVILILVVVLDALAFIVKSSLVFDKFTVSPLVVGGEIFSSIGRTNYKVS